jgi:hypothetical protein
MRCMPHADRTTRCGPLSAAASPCEIAVKNLITHSISSTQSRMTVVLNVVQLSRVLSVWLRV